MIFPLILAILCGVFAATKQYDRTKSTYQAAVAALIAFVLFLVIYYAFLVLIVALTGTY